MAKIWFFGDSFCANNSNWVKQVAENVGCSIANFGVGGASLDDTLTTLIKKSKEIKKQQEVLSDIKKLQQRTRRSLCHEFN